MSSNDQADASSAWPFFKDQSRPLHLHPELVEVQQLEDFDFTRSLILSYEASSGLDMIQPYALSATRSGYSTYHSLNIHLHRPYYATQMGKRRCGACSQLSRRWKDAVFRSHTITSPAILVSDFSFKSGPIGSQRLELVPRHSIKVSTETK